METQCGTALLGAPFHYWPRAALCAHAAAIAGAAIGTAALAVGAGPATPANTLYLRTILAALVLSAAVV